MWSWLFYLVPPALYVAHCLVVQYVCDDGFIAFQYVRNLLRGEGLVYNPGERVEGYSDFLWVVLLAGVQFVLPKIALLRIAQGLGILFGVATIVLALRFSVRLHRRLWPFGALAATFLAAHSGLAAWATAGLETTLIAFLLLAGAFSYIVFLDSGRRPWLPPLIFALAALTRPDGVIAFAVTTMHLIATTHKRTGRLVNHDVVRWLAVFVAIYVPYFVWRVHYYGYLLPNPAYAKVGEGIFQYLRGLAYLARYLTTYGGFVFLPAALLLLRRPREVWRDYLALLVAGHALFIIYVGGDGLAFYRFAVYIVPVAYLLVQEGLADLQERLASRLISAARAVLVPSVVIIGLLFTMQQSVGPLVLPAWFRWYEPQSELFFPGRGSDHAYRWFDNYFVDRLAIAANWLETNSPKQAVVASTAAGSIAYHMDRTVIDMLGLNDVHIAHSKGAVGGVMGRGQPGHEKGDGKYVLSRSPDYILMGNVAVLSFPLDEAAMAQKLVLKSEHEIWGDPEFHRRYELVCVPLDERGAFRYFTFYKKKGASLPPHTGNLSRASCTSSR